jgi:small basic protein
MNPILPIIGFAAGLALGLIGFSKLQIPGEVASMYAPYLSLATLAGLDAVLGGVKAGIEGRFQTDIFVSGFVLNALLAAGLALLGDWIGVDLFLAGLVYLGQRVFLNLSLIRRYYLTKVNLARQQRDTQSQSVPMSQNPIL